MALQGQQLLPQPPWLPQHCQDWLPLAQTIHVFSHPPQGHFQGLLDFGIPLCPWQMHPEYDTGEGDVLPSWESPVLPSQDWVGL